MILYQTVEDRNEPDFIKSNAPFRCRKINAWLGEGYYFWDTLIDNAHWWGKTVYQKKGYVVLKFLCDCIHEKCFDLHGNLEHVQYFNEIVDFLEEKGLVNNLTTVPWLIKYLKENADLDKIYDGIRVYGHYSKAINNTMKIFFKKDPRSKQYLELTPPVQLCLFRNNSFNLQSGIIVFPLEYVAGAVV